MRVTRRRLVEILTATKGAQIVSLMAITVPPMRKTDNPFYGRVEQVIRVNGIIGWIYETAVNRQRLREGKLADFKAEPRRWGERIPGTPFVAHQDRLYLEVKCEEIIELWYRYSESKMIIPEDEISSFIIRSSSAPHQGLQKEVVCRDFRLDHLLSILGPDGKLLELTKRASG